jgi:hypothetical protein
MLAFPPIFNELTFKIGKTLKNSILFLSFILCIEMEKFFPKKTEEKMSKNKMAGDVKMMVFVIGRRRGRSRRRWTDKREWLPGRDLT